MLTRRAFVAGAGTTCLATVAGAQPVAGIVFDVGWFRTTRNPSTGLAVGRVNAFSLNRLARKYLGFVATLAVLYAVYWTLPEYAGDFYSRALARAICGPIDQRPAVTARARLTRS